MKTGTIRIVVLGGGYAGVIAALRLAGKSKRLDTTVTLINGLDTFVERPLLHEQATGAEPTIRPLTHLLRGTKARFEQGWVTRVDPKTQQVDVQQRDDKRTFAYDYLIYALGSRVNRMGVAGIDQYAYTLDPWGKRTTQALYTRLCSTEQPVRRVIVVGGGATGLEAATQIKGIHPHVDVSLISNHEVGSFKGARVQAQVASALNKQGIHVLEHKAVTRVDGDGVTLADGEKLTADLTIWAGGFVASSIAREAGLQVNERNQILVDPYLRSITHPSIYAVGDAAMTVEEPGAPMRMAIYTAVVGGAQAADNIVAKIKGQEMRPLSFAWYGQGIALGPHDAVGFNTFPSDRPIGPILRGMVAVRMRSFFVGLLTASLEFERRFPGVLRWSGRGRYARSVHRHKALFETPTR